MRVQIEDRGAFIEVWTPENNSVWCALRDMGGEQDKETGWWTLPRPVHRDVVRLCYDTFTDDGTAFDRVDVRIKAPETVTKMGDTVMFSGRVVGVSGYLDAREARALLVNGRIVPTGGGKTRKVEVKASTEIVLQDVPRAAAANDDVFDVIEIHERSPSADALREERGYHEKRLREIDSDLSKLSQEKTPV